MSEEKKHSEKLKDLIDNDLEEWYKELAKDTEASVEGKIEIGQPFAAAISQLRTAVKILQRHEATLAPVEP